MSSGTRAALVLCGVAALSSAGCRATRPESTRAPADPAGLWEGEMVHGEARHLLRLDLSGDTARLAARVDLPDQYALGYTLPRVTREGATLAFELPDVLPPARFTGTVERGRIRGHFASPAGADTLRGTFELWRRPRARAPYATEEVTFRNGDVALRGTLFLPPGGGRRPVVVFLHGSGPQTRESYLRYFADRFARRGIAALIYDKRNTGRTDIPPWQQGGGTFAELADDALAAVRLLRSRPEVDSARIGLWGLSQGAWLAPLAAARSPDVAFAILILGGGVTPAEQELYDDEVKLRAAGVPQAGVDTALRLLRLADEYVRSGADADWERLQRELGQLRARPWFRVLDRFPLILPREAPAWVGLRPDLDYDPRPALERLRVPVLVVLGEADQLTPARETARRIDQALERSGNPDYTIRLVPGADHGLWVPPAPRATWLAQRPAAGWVDEMVDWLVQRTPASSAAAR